MGWFLLILLIGFIVIGLPIIIIRAVVRAFKKNKTIDNVPDYMKEIRENNKKADEAAKKLGYESAIDFRLTPIAERKLSSDISTEDKHVLEMTVLTSGKYDPTDYINEQNEKRRLHEKYKNRLIPQDKPPSDPPKYAREGTMISLYNDVIVSGTEQINDKSFLPEVKVNDKVNLELVGGDGCIAEVYEVSDYIFRKLGYLEMKAELQELFDWLRSDYPAWIIISKIDGEHIYLSLAFYVPFDEKYSKSKTFSLSGTKKKSLEYNIGHYLADTEISFDYDCDKDKYAVYSDEGNIIGYLTTAIEDIVDGEYLALISDVGLDDSSKWYVKVTFHYNPDNDALGDTKSGILKPIKCKYCNVASISGKENICAKCGAPLELD